MSGRIFINYRRDDSPSAAGRISDRLAQHFGRSMLFMDVDAIEPGIDFVKALDEQVGQCSAFIAVMGPAWIKATNAAGRRRLDDPNDYVRVEIESALRRDVRVVPVLVDGASMPSPDDLPEPLKPLARRNAFEISHHRFGADVDELARVIHRATGLPVASSAAKERTAMSWSETLFSFDGRISRQTYWLNSALVLLVCFILLAAVGIALGPTAFQANGQPTQTFMFFYYISTIFLFWPAFALASKRLHDFGRGSGALAVLIVLSLLTVALQVASVEPAASFVGLIATALMILIGCIKGEAGTNKYGHPPLSA